MNQIQETLLELQKQDIKLWVDQGRLLYDAPKEAMTPEIINQIKQQKSAIITFLQENASQKIQPILPVSRDQQLPLSFAQERLWFIDQFEGASPVYNLQKILRLQGKLNIKALEKAIIHLGERHESLRTNFQKKEGKPDINIKPCLDLPLEIINIENLGGNEQEKEIKKIINLETHKCFDLENDTLVKFTVIKCAQQNHLLIISIHHIITDGWSMGILTKELSHLYQAYSQNIAPILAPLPIQYVDFAVWQRQYFQEKILASQLSYWQKQLQGIPPLLSLPLDKPRPQIQTFTGATKRFTISPYLTRQLKVFSQENKVTLFITLLSAFAVLLFRYSNQADFIIGSPIANRNRQDIEGIIGFFSNNLALRIKLGENPTFAELLQQVKTTALDAYEHQDLPFEKLVQELKIERNLSHNPLFQVLFALQNTPDATFKLEALEIETLKAKRQTAKFDLSLFTWEKGEELDCAWEYKTDLFNADTIERMTGHFQTLVAAIISNPHEKISLLPLLTASEKKQILIDWNNTKIDYPKDKCIHQLFEEQVEKTPKAIAVVFEEQQLTYRQLNEKANQLAHYLQKQAVKPEVLVGICLDASLEMVVGILGILKAGGAYVPLDTTYPQDRLQFMLEDSQIPILLTQEKLVDTLQIKSQSIFKLDTDWESIKQESKDDLFNLVQSNNLAYVIYTSGSTGKPKGVMMNHHSVSNLIQWQTNRANFAPQLRTLQFAPISFDVSFQEIFSTLCSGGTLVMISEDQRKDFSKLPLFLQEKSIERVFLPFVALEKLSEIIEHQSESVGNLQEIITAGEQLKLTPSIEKLRQKVKTLHNQYGPTETHVVTEFTLEKDLKEIAYLPPIGYPISNNQVYVFDNKLQPVPIGVTGEIYIGGVGVARGYLNQRELTTEKFIDNPFGEGKLYKTGDLARYLPDGNIEFLGRIDHQVKIRGFRIELGEIEANLLQHPNIEEILVIITDNDQEKRLVAYIIPTQEEVPTIENIRHFLQQRLPDYMIPHAYVPLEAFPLTPNGKIDRKALPSPERKHSLNQEFIPPQTSTEKKLAKIWQKVLWKEEEIGINDNFFDLGGHSLLSIRLVSEIEQEFAQKIPLKALFKLSTIAELAPHLEQELTPKQEQIETRDSAIELIPEIYHQLYAYTSGWKGKRVKSESLIFGLNTKGSSNPLFWCLQGFRELEQLAKYLGDDQPVYGMRSGHLIMEYTPENIQALAAHYVQEILEVQSESPYLIGGNCQATSIVREIARQLIDQGKTVALLLLLEDYKPKSYPSKVALFFGRESYINLEKHFPQSELAWKQLYRTGFSLNLISGIHGEFFNEPNIQEFTAKIKMAISVALKEPIEPIDNYNQLPESDLVGNLREALRMIAPKSTRLAWRESIGEVWNSHLHQAMEEIRSLIPKRETLILVDESKWGADELLADYRWFPFLEKDGHYWGAPPDELTAVGELERLRQEGANFIVFGWPAFWWLDYYKGLRHHLDETYSLVNQNDHIIVFELTK